LAPGLIANQKIHPGVIAMNNLPVEPKPEILKAKEEWDAATHSLANQLKITLAENDGEFSDEDLEQIKYLLDSRDRKQEAFMRCAQVNE
jgi:hypothetical protein